MFQASDTSASSSSTVVRSACCAGKPALCGLGDGHGVPVEVSPASMAREEVLDILDADGAARGRQRGQHLPAVALGVQPLVENRQHATVVVGAQEAPDALLQP